MLRRDDGFTLLEVLVAFAILSLTLLSVLHAFESGLAQERAAARASARVLEARSLLDEIGVSRPLAAAEGTLSGGERWQLAVTRLDPPGPGPGAGGLPHYRVELAVSDRGRPVLALGTVKLGASAP